MNTFINSSKIQLLKSTDILVIGGGSAGCAAAITAGKYSDLDVTLIERYGFLGGTSTQMLDTFYGFFTPANSPKKIVGGIPSEIVNSLNDAGEVFLRPNTYGAGTGVNYNPEYLKLTLDKLLSQNNVDCYLHTLLIDVEVTEKSNVCVVWTKEGIFKIEAKKVIDASGDADFCHLAKISYETAGEFDPAQSMTTTFRMANVDLETYEKAGGKKKLSELMVKVFEAGKYDLPRKDGSAHLMNMPGCISTVAVKVTDRSAWKVKELTAAEMEGRKQAFNYEKFFRNEVPGYANAKIIGLSNQIGVRETRRVYGEERLNKADCMAAVIPEDVILLCGAPIEDHRKGENGEDETYWEYVPNGGVYGVPYGTIVPKNQQNVWMVGRCFSAEHDAHASCRSMGQTMSMGQAAANAAVIGLTYEYSANQMNISKLHDSLLQQKVILTEPESEAFIGKNDWGLNE